MDFKLPSFHNGVNQFLKINLSQIDGRKGGREEETEREKKREKEEILTGFVSPVNTNIIC